MQLRGYKQKASQHFSTRQWLQIPENGRIYYAKMCYIFEECYNLGITVVKPLFMKFSNSNNEKYKYLNNLNVEITYKCKYCKVSYAIKKDRDRHMKICKSRFEFVLKKKFVCQFCQYNTDVITHYKDHQKVHTKEKAFLCVICKKSFSQKSNLKVHIKEMHLNIEKQHKCDRCPYKAHRKADLREHEKMHLNIVTFVCETCKKGFRTKESYVLHSYIHNNAEKPNQCCWIGCQKAFIYKKSLMRHIKMVYIKQENEI